MAVNPYDEADKAIRAINRENLRIFTRLKNRLMKADELHIIREVTDAYDESLKLVERWFLRVAQTAYLRAIEDKKRKSPIDRDWLIDFLMEADEATKYIFLTEADRKKARLIEALAVSPDKGPEIDKTLRLWTRQIGWEAVSVTDAATLEAYEDDEVPLVRWNSMHDNRVCDECWERNGMIFEIDKIPPKHPACRCWMTPVFKREDET